MEPADPAAHEPQDSTDDPFTVVLPSRHHAQLLTQLLAAELEAYATSVTAGRHRDPSEPDPARDVASELGEVRDSLIDQLTTTG